MEQVLMRCETDCEIPAIANACGLAYEPVAAVHDEIDGDFRDNANGSPYHILADLKALGVSSRTVTDDDILGGRTNPSKVIVLVHSPESPWLMQHWVNVFCINGSTITLLWNYPGQAMKTFTHEQFRKLYRDGFPNCAFEVDAGEIQKLNIFQRFWVWLTGFFL